MQEQLSYVDARHHTEIDETSSKIRGDGRELRNDGDLNESRIIAEKQFLKRDFSIFRYFLLNSYFSLKSVKKINKRQSDLIGRKPARSLHGDVTQFQLLTFRFETNAFDSSYSTYFIVVGRIAGHTNRADYLSVSAD